MIPDPKDGSEVPHPLVVVLGQFEDVLLTYHVILSLLACVNAIMYDIKIHIE